MAEGVASTLIEAVFRKLANEALKQVVREKGIHSELKKLGRTLSRIQALLIDASDKEEREIPVQKWLNDLQHLAYEIDDLLDDLATEAMHDELTDQSSRASTESSQSTRLYPKLDNITNKLQDLEKEKVILGLRVKHGGLEVRNNGSIYENRVLETSLVDPSGIVGRQGDKEALVLKLLVDEPRNSENFSIVPIVGMGGVGKTTLAKLLYNDEQVNDHFQLKAWVCVSDEWDTFGMSNIIFQSVTGETKEFKNLNLLQIALRDRLKNKLFLLVLDDVWSEDSDDWESLVAPLKACAPGSKIIMTTRKEKLLKQLGCGKLNHLQCLSHDDAMCLFAQHALGENNFDSHPRLKALGEGIVRKCDGLPLALRALGRLLRTKEDEVDWKEIEDSEIWSLDEGGKIIPALRLSYRELPTCLKQLFVYCSLFPKGYVFDKEDLVWLWMAEGFLHQVRPSKSTIERLGNKFFDELLSRSFFQHSPNDESLFVMHDLMNDLATSLAGDFYFRLEKELEKNFRKQALDKCRHMSFVCEEYLADKKFEVFEGAKGLRTFLFVGMKERWGNYLSNKVLADLLPQLPLIKVISLSGYEISEVPESIGSLKHLRYLNLSLTKIKHLPESVCDLYNLETLIVFGCSSLTSLPNNFSKLKNLRHLNLSLTKIKHLPESIYDLYNLETLIVFGCSSLTSLPNNFSKVKNLRHLNLSLTKIKHLPESVYDLYNLETLIVFGCSSLTSLPNNILKLKNLRHLDIRDTSKLKDLPLGVAKLKSLQTLSKIIIGGENDFSITQLKDFENLRGKVSIKGLEKVKNATEARGADLSQKGLTELELEWSGVSDASRKDTTEYDVLDALKPYNDCLKRLGIVNYLGLEFPKWVGDPSFRQLASVSIRGCKKCTSLPPLGQLPSLKGLCIQYMDDVKDVGLEFLGTGVAFPSLETLTFRAMRGWKVWSTNSRSGVGDSVFPRLQVLRIGYCPNLVEFSLEGDSVFPSLQELCITNCPNLVKVSLKAPLLSLRNLRIYECGAGLLRSLVHAAPSLTKLEIGYISGLTNEVWGGVILVLKAVEELEIRRCDEIRYLWDSKEAEARSKVLVNLRKLKVDSCKNLVSLGEKDEEYNYGSNLLTSLRSLEISSSENFKHLSCPNNIETLEIRSCYSVACVSFSTGGGQKLTTLTIQGCKSTAELLFADLQLPSLTSLTTLMIEDCQNMDVPTAGLWSPNLRVLSIRRLKKPISEWGPQKFPSTLVDLTLHGETEEATNWSQLSHLHIPSSLTRLCFESFTNLKTVSEGLQHLTSLQHLYIGKCPTMKELPETLLHSLLSLEIWKCPDLKERCCRGGSYWPQISHIPCIRIDGESQT